MYAEWMSHDEAHQLIDEINRTPTYLRKPTARQLGEKLRVSNKERELLRLKTIKPFDMTDKQLEEQRKAKNRARKWHLRRAAKKQTREVYLAGNSISRQKPWQTEGISRATWFRKRRAKSYETSPSAKQESHETSPSAVNLTISADTPVSLENVDRLKGRKWPSGKNSINERTKGYSLKKLTTEKDRQNEIEDNLLSRPRASLTHLSHELSCASNQSQKNDVPRANGADLSENEELALKNRPQIFCRVTIREIRHPAIKSGPNDNLDDFAPI